MRKTTKEELQSAILLLRFGCTQPRQFRHRIMTLRDIANNIGRSTTFVRKVCLDYELKVRKLMEPMKSSTRKHARLL